MQSRELLRDVLVKSRRVAGGDDSPDQALVDEIVSAFAEEDPSRKKLFASRVSSRDNFGSGGTVDLLLVFLQKRRLEQPLTLWRLVVDQLVGPSSASRPPSLYRLLASLIAGHYSELGAMFRREALRFVSDELGGVRDFAEKLMVLEALTAGCTDLSPIETEFGDTCVRWLSNHFDQLSAAHARELLGLLCRALAAAPSFLTTENASLALQRACVVASGLRHASQVPVVEACLALLEAVVQHNVALPAHCLGPIVASLCCTVNIERLCDQSWRVGRCLLASRVYGLDTLDALCGILQAKTSAAPPSQNAGSVLRGAVFFVAMSCWGKDRVESLNVAPVSVLGPMWQATKCGFSVAAYEVLLSVRRLVRKQGPELSIEWDSIFGILHEMAAYTPTNPSFARVLVDTLLTLRSLADANRFLADPQRQLWLLEAHAHLLPPREALRLLRRRLAQVPPLVTPEQLDQCLRRHLVEDVRAEARAAALVEVMEWLTHGASSGTSVDEARAAVVVPVWRAMLDALLATPAGQERPSLMALLQTLARNAAEAAVGVRKAVFVDCVQLLAPTVDGAAAGGGRNAVLGQVYDDAATEGLGSVLAAELAAGRGRRARFALDALVGRLSHPAVSVRQRALHYVAGLRAGPLYTVSLFGQASGVRVAAEQQQDGGAATAGSGSPSELTLARAVEVLGRAHRTESSKLMLTSVYVALSEILWNRFVLRGVALDSLALELCAHLRQGKLAEPFRGHSHEGLEFVKSMLQTATLLVAYVDQFRAGAAVVVELCNTFVHLLRYPFAGGVFDAAGRSTLQLICLNGLCVAVTHQPAQTALIAPAIVDAVCALMGGARLLEPHVPRVLDYLARFPTVMATVPRATWFNVVEGLVQGPGAGEPTDLRHYSFRLKTAALWLLGMEPADRLACYNRCLPTLLAAVGGPASLVVEAHLDQLANIVYLSVAAGRAVAPHERFGFVGRPSLVMVQGHCVLELVSGVHDWTLVTVRRPSGRVAWIARMQNDVRVLASAAEASDTPVRTAYTSLFRSARRSERALSGGSFGSPVASSPLVVNGTSVSSRLLDLSRDNSSNDVPGTWPGLVALTAAAAVAAEGQPMDAPPLNPKNALEKRIAKPDLASYALDSPRPEGYDVRMTVGRGGEADEDGEDDDDLRMAALFSYDDDEEDRDVFFRAHSLNGRSTQSSSSASPPKPLGVARMAAARGMPHRGPASAAAVVPDPIQQQQPQASPKQQQQQQPSPPPQPQQPPPASPQPQSLPPAAAAAPVVLERGSSETPPPLSMAVRTETVSNLPPPASLLFLQLRYIPFSDDAPLRVTATPAVTRALSVLDYMHPCETHKVGVLFVAPGQRTEAEMFANRRGSVEYTRFLRRIGETVRLKGYRGYAGGLDTASDGDGQFSVRLRDETMEVMLHCATLMPGNLLAKKRHLGNDNVLIVWDESHEFDPTKVLQSDLNIVSLVISPVGGVARLSVFRKREMGHFSPVSVNQLVRLDALPIIVLHTAVNAGREVAAATGDESALQGVATRLKQIKKIKQLAKQAIISEQQQQQQQQVAKSPTVIEPSRRGSVVKSPASSSKNVAVAPPKRKTSGPEAVPVVDEATTRLRAQTMK